MRTPNCNCIICNNSFYRRPSELKKVDFVCCVGCRSEAYKKFPNKNSIDNLKLGREKGTNHLKGILKKQSQKDKMSIIMSEWCEKNKEAIAERGKKIRGDKHYNWKNNITSLNQSIRRLNENRKWMDNVKNRDKKCVNCNTNNELESHHIMEVATIIKKHNILNLKDAMNCKELWDINNGITLCSKCHCAVHNRKYTIKGYGRNKK
jgi:hypothetical protein